MITATLKPIVEVSLKQAWQLLLPSISSASILQKRGIKKHWDPKYRSLRAKKFLKVDLPNYEEMRREPHLSPEEIRSKMKEAGVAPIRPWTEKPITLSSTGDIFEAFVPPEGDGKISTLSKAGVMLRTEMIAKKGKSYMAVRKIRSFEDNFDLPTLAQQVQDIYIQAHEALVARDEDKLHDLVTEKCYPEMTMSISRKTISWKFLKSLEPPFIVQVRCTDLITKENVFAQATLRMHSQQILAVYDRFGRLMHGSEVMVKDVLEYIVFEKHLADTYGKWRIHGKIIPHWMPPKETVRRTFVKQPEPKPTPEPAQPVPETNVTTSEKQENVIQN